MLPEEETTPVLELLRVPLFKRLILAVKDAELNPEVIETCVLYYAKIIEA